MSNEYPAGDPRYPGGETPSGGPPPPPPPPPPGGGYQEWQHQPPPGAGPRYKDPEAVSRGVRAAALIFAVSVLVHLLTLFGVWVSGNNVNGGYFFPEGMVVALGGFIAAIVMTFKLPLDSRAPFWISGLAFMALSFIIWGVTCGVALSIPTT